MVGKLLELRPNKNLIDSDFEGYKLSLDQIPGFHFKLPNEIYKLEHTGSQFSYIYLELLSMQNHLFTDPWDGNSIYYVNKNKEIIRTLWNFQNNRIENTQTMLNIPECNKSPLDYCFNISIVFASDKIALISDGTGYIFIVDTGLRTDLQNWTIEYSSEILGKNKPFVLLDARAFIKNDDQFILHCLLTSITEEIVKEKSTTSAKTMTDLFWITFKKSENMWQVENIFNFNTKGSLKYGCFSPKCECLFVESTKPISIASENNTDKIGESVESSNARYYWQQSVDDIKIWFNVPPTCVKDEISINLSEKNLCIKVQNEVILFGNTFQMLDPNLTTWNIMNNKLEIILMKSEEGLMWNYLIENDKAGEEIIHPELAKEIHERLSHLCSENEAPMDDTSPTFNPGQLEACDSNVEEYLRLIAIETETKNVTREINLYGHQKLFNIRIHKEEPQYFCIRHDVDGILWKLNYNSEELCEHVGTLKAFGYIAASKQSKYCTCSPDLSYAVIAATKQNIFIYRQNCAVNSELRNRKSGKDFKEVGKQYLISLNSNDEIIGIHASNKVLFILTKSELHAYLL